MPASAMNSLKLPPNSVKCQQAMTLPLFVAARRCVARAPPTLPPRILRKAGGISPIADLGNIGRREHVNACGQSERETNSLVPTTPAFNLSERTVKRLLGSGDPG